MILFAWSLHMDILERSEILVLIVFVDLATVYVARFKYHCLGKTELYWPFSVLFHWYNRV